MKKPLSNLAAEAAVLGAILFDNANLPRVREILSCEDAFYAPAHQAVYAAMLQLHSEGRVADGISLRELFQSNDRLEEVGGEKLLVDLIDSAGFGPEVRDYARIIADLHARRTLIDIGATIMARAQKLPDGASIDGVVSEGVSSIESILNSRAARVVWENAADAVNDELADLEGFLETGKPRGMSTGLSKLDDMLGGLHRGDLYVIGGASSMGKTALAVNIAFGAARSEGRRVVLFSQEMTRQQLAWRVMSNQARRSGCGKVAYQALRNGSIGQNEYAILKAGAEHLPKSVKWNTARGLSVDDVKAGVRAASKSLGGIDVIVIDYLQILEIEQRKGSNRAADIQHATMQMKKLAGDMDACIVLLSQLKRLDHREDKRPLLSDLRESGGIEQDADTVLLAHREDYYLERSEPPWEPKDKHTEWWVKMQNAQGKLDVYVPKQRMGPIGLVQLHFEKETDLIVDEAAQIDDEDGFL